MVGACADPPQLSFHVHWGDRTTAYVVLSRFESLAGSLSSDEVDIYRWGIIAVVYLQPKNVKNLSQSDQGLQPCGED